MKAALIALIPLVSYAGVVDPVYPKNEWTPSWQNPSDGFQIKKNHFGSGTPAVREQDGVDSASPVADGYFHVPGFLPGHPTAATIYPQSQTVECVMIGEKKVCDGYRIDRMTGRGEYVFVVPVVKPQEAPLFTPVPDKHEEKPKKKPKKKKKLVTRSPVCK